MRRHNDSAQPSDANRAGEVAEFEHELFRGRTGEGRARAVARGMKLGRQPKLTPHLDEGSD